MADVVWSPIKVADKNGAIKTIGVGESVSRDKLGIDKDHYDHLKEIGTIRSQKYPNDVRDGESIRERNVRVLHEGLQEAEASMYADMPDLSVDETSHLAEREVPPPE